MTSSSFPTAFLHLQDTGRQPLSNSSIPASVSLGNAYFFFLKSSPEDTFSFLLEREGGRERSIYVREKHRLHMCPNQGSNPQPGYVPRRRIELAAFRFMGLHSNQLSHTHQECLIILMIGQLGHNVENMVAEE